jgi:integrase
MSTVNIRSALVPPVLAGRVCLGRRSIPRFWASIWIDLLKGSLEPSTKKRYLNALERLYEATERQRGTDCLDRLLADLAFDELENILVAFLAQLRNESAVDGADMSLTWSSALTFVIDILRHGSSTAGIRAGVMESRLQRLVCLYSQLSPVPVRAPPPIRALPPAVVNDLYAIFAPQSDRNPFKTETQRWRNLLVFMLLLRLGLRRGEAALLAANAIKDDIDPTSGRSVTWIDVEGVPDEDPRYEQPGLKTALSRRQLPVPQEIMLLTNTYVQNYRGRTHYPQMLMSQKRRPLSLRSINEIFETATMALSAQARSSLEKQGVSSVSCHDLRHTCAVVRMQLYRDVGDDVDRAMEKLRVFFGWTPESDMPRRYARAYFETKLAEVWNEKFDQFVDALRRSVHRSDA